MKENSIEEEEINTNTRKETKKYNNKTMIPKRNCIMEVTIDLMDLKTQNSDKKINILKLK